MYVGMIGETDMKTYYYCFNRIIILEAKTLFLLLENNIFDRKIKFLVLTTSKNQGITISYCYLSEGTFGPKWFREL